MRILVDTNIFLDLFLNRNDDSVEFVKLCKRFKNQIYVTSMSLRDIGYIAHRYFHNEEDCKKLQSKVYQMCYKVIGISADAAITSIYSNVEDYEDSLLVEAANEAMVDLIVTNNIRDFSKSKIRTMSPKEFNEICYNILQSNIYS